MKREMDEGVAGPQESGVVGQRGRSGVAIEAHWERGEGIERRKRRGSWPQEERGQLAGRLAKPDGKSGSGTGAGAARGVTDKAGGAHRIEVWWRTRTETGWVGA